jgi:O-acetyl-ADP-ribose deacetylase (regulator of RNase III)
MQKLHVYGERCRTQGRRHTVMEEKFQIGQTELKLIVGDITEQKTEAIVNAANSGLRGGGGVDGAIHRAGGPEIMEECRKIGGCPTGDAVITTAGDLPAARVIHAVGPRYRGGSAGERELLASAYRRSLEVAAERGIRTIAFPSISTGAYGYPIDEASEVALETINNYIENHPGVFDNITLVLFSESDYKHYLIAARQLGL